MKGRERPEYVVGSKVCLACEALDKHRAEHAKKDEKAIESGRNPAASRLDEVYLMAEARALAAQQSRL